MYAFWDICKKNLKFPKKVNNLYFIKYIRQYFDNVSRKMNPSDLSVFKINLTSYDDHCCSFHLRWEMRQHRHGKSWYLSASQFSGLKNVRKFVYFLRVAVKKKQTVYSKTLLRLTPYFWQIYFWHCVDHVDLPPSPRIFDKNHEILGFET